MRQFAIFQKKMFFFFPVGVYAGARNINSIIIYLCFIYFVYIDVSFPIVAFNNNIINAIVSENNLDLLINLIYEAFF